jgi:hypothetical protein
VVRGFYEQGPDGPLPGSPVAKVRSLGDLDATLGKHDNVLPAVELDGSAPFEKWPAAVTGSGVGSYALVFASNVVHIAPWAVAEGIFAGAAVALRTGGSLIFHGPFKLNGPVPSVAHVLSRPVDVPLPLCIASVDPGVQCCSALPASGASAQPALHLAQFGFRLQVIRMQSCPPNRLSLLSFRLHALLLF